MAMVKCERCGKLTENMQFHNALVHREAQIPTNPLDLLVSLHERCNGFIWKWLFKITPAKWINGGCTWGDESWRGRWGVYVTQKYGNS